MFDQKLEQTAPTGITLPELIPEFTEMHLFWAF